MSRQLNQAALDALADNSVELALLVTIDAAEVGGESPLDRPLRLTDRPGGIVDTRTDPGVTYVASNTLRVVGAMRETLEPRSSDIKLTFTATSEVIAQYLAHNPSRWRVEIRVAVLDSDVSVHDVILMFAGYGAGVRVRGKPERPDVELQAANHWSAFEVVGGRETNSKSQGQHFPGDRVFDLAFSLVRDRSWAQRVSLDAERDAVHHIPVVYGRRKVEAVPIFQKVGGDSNRYLYMVCMIAEGVLAHPANSEIWIDDIPMIAWNRWSQLEAYSAAKTHVWRSGNDPDVRAVIRFYPGLDDQPADEWFISEVPEWTAAHRGRGVALLYCRFAYDKDLFSGVPRIHLLAKDKQLLTPDGSGATHAGFVTFPWQLCDYLLSRRYGRGVPLSDIDQPSYLDATNQIRRGRVSDRLGLDIGAVTAITDNQDGSQTLTIAGGVAIDATHNSAIYSHDTEGNVAKRGNVTGVTASGNYSCQDDPNGGNFPRICMHKPQIFLRLSVRADAFVVGDQLTLIRRYYGHSMWHIDTEKKVLDVIKEGLASAGSWLTWRGGKYAIVLKADAPIVGTLDHRHLVGAIDVAWGSKQRMANQVKASFLNPNKDWTEDEVLFPDGIEGGAALRADWESADGSPLVRTIVLPTVAEAPEALHQAAIALYESRGLARVKTRATLSALAYNAGDVVGVTSPFLGWINKPHRIHSLSFDYSQGRVDLELAEHDAGIYQRRLLSDADLFQDTIHRNPLVVETPTDFAVASTDTIGADNQRQFGMEISWVAADETASTYELRGRQVDADGSAGDWVSLLLRDTYYQVSPLPLGSRWDLQVAAINDLGASSPWTSITQHTVTADTTPPAAPTEITVRSGFQQLIVSWTQPPNVDLAFVEIYLTEMGTIPAAPALTVGSGGQGVLAGLIDDTAYLVWVRSVDIAGNRSDPAGPYQGRTSRFGERDIGVLKREYIYRTHPTGQLRPQERARNNWNYDEPVAPWRDNAPSLTAEQPFLIRDERPVPVGVEVGDAVDGQWIGAAIIGHYGVDGASGDDGSGVEFIYALTATGLVGDDQLPDDNWRFDLPRVAGGLQWYDEAPDTTPARPFLVVAARRTQGFPRAGDRVADVWGRPAVQSHYGDDGVSASVGAPVIWFEQPDDSYEPAATTQDVEIRFYRGRREFAQGTVHFQRVGNGLHDSISTDTPAEVLGEFRASFSKGRRGGQVLGITATWHGLDGDETNNISITACAYIVRAGVSEERIRQLIGEVIGEGEQPPTQQPETQPPATTTQITQTAYHRAAAKPAAPTSAPGSYPPSGWREIRPSPTVTAAVWQSTRTVTMRNGAAVSATNWTTPTEVAARLPPPSTQITQTAYHRAAAKPAAPTSAPGSYPPSGWREIRPSPTVTAAVWQSTRTVTMRNGAAVSATNWTTPTEVAARLPPPSTQITQTAYHRAAAKPAAPTSAPGSYPPSGWSETQPSPTVTAAVWQSTRTVTMRNGAAVSATNWTTPTEVAARLPQPLMASATPAYEIVELSSVHGRQGVIFLVSASGGVPPYTGTGSFTRYFSGGGEGIHDESFTVTDDAGNSATATTRVEVVVIQGDV